MVVTMSNISVHIDPALSASAIQPLEDSGFEIRVGNGPLVDYVVTGHEATDE